MPIVLGIDIGTTSITALAVDTADGSVLTRHTTANQAETTTVADQARGRSEWDVVRMAENARRCLAAAAAELGPRRNELAGIGITGQQHGMVVVDDQLAPLTPFVNWQDRRGDDTLLAGSRSYVQEASERAGPEAPRRTGCRLATGYMAVTLFWLRENGLLPGHGTACFVMDYFGAMLTGRPPATDATCAASSGALDVVNGAWDAAILDALGLPRGLFPPVRPSGAFLGGLTDALAANTGLPAGLPIYVGIGDNQASFLGSVADRRRSALVNVGTGAQAAAFTEQFHYDPHLETRPFPGGGYLLVSAGLCGGRSYALLERFFRDVGRQFFQADRPELLYDAMNRLAERVPRGAGGLRCEPYFTGSRMDPDLRATWSGMSAENFTPAHLMRALLEGLARTLHDGFAQVTGGAQLTCQRLVGAGNGLRENRVLARIVAEEFGMRLSVPQHREEAAFGAALLGAVGAGVFPDLVRAGRLIQYDAQ
jgi:sugar (pentulose or hexulose) kinase